MPPRNDDRPPQFFIGPETQSNADSLLHEARKRVRDEDDRNKESHRLARRLLIAFVCIVLLGVGFYIVLPYYGLWLPPFVPILCFGAIAAGAILSLNDGHGPGYNRDDPPEQGNGDDDDGCAVGMCSGPRPLRAFKDPKDPKSR